MLTVTPAAREKIDELMQAEQAPALALRVGIRGRGPSGFQYDLGFVEASSKEEGDAVVDCEGFQVFVDAASQPQLQGSTLDFVTEHGESGFKIDNPNPLWADPLAAQVQQVIDDKINPGVAAHGGFVQLLDVKDRKVYIQLGGGCQGCGMADVTLKQGIEVMIREAVPEIEAIVDTTDHAGGTNPFYQPSKGGGPTPLS